jgi:hypothetical protein
MGRAQRNPSLHRKRLMGFAALNPSCEAKRVGILLALARRPATN